MNLICLRNLFLLMLLLLSSNATEVYAFSLAGDWQITNMVTDKKQAIVRIWQTQPNEWAAKMVKVYTPDKRLQPDKIMMMHIKKLKINTASPTTSTQWDGEYINPYAVFSNDPSSLPQTRIERCRLVLTKNHKQLLVRIYQHLPLFGHLDVWTRIKK